MFFDNISYNILSIIRNTIIIIFLVIMFLTTLKENRKWICLTYLALGLVLTIVCILIIPKEIISNINYTMSIIIGITSTICTAIWAARFGKDLIPNFSKKRKE